MIFYTFDFLSTGSDDDDDDEVMSDPKIFFKTTQNIVYNSPWVCGHR